MTAQQADVVIVGAGPVGLTLAMDLARRGIDVSVVEIAPSRRAAEREVQPRVGALDGDIPPAGRRRRSCATPACLPTIPNDVAYRTTMTGDRAVAHSDSLPRATATPRRAAPTPGGRRRSRRTASTRSTWSRCCSRMPRRCRACASCNRTRIDELRRRIDERRVGRTASISTAARPVRIRCRYMVGCDGGRSMVRKSDRRAACTAAEWSSACSRPTSARRRCSALIASRPPAWATFALNPRRCGNVYRDRRARDLADAQLPAAGRDGLRCGRPRLRRSAQILGVGADFEYEIISQGRLDRPAAGGRPVPRPARVHLRRCRAPVDPYAGYGMNAGIADADESVVAARGAAAGLGRRRPILDAYEAERQPITEQVSQFRDEPCACDVSAARRRAGRHRGARRRRRCAARSDRRRAPIDLNVQQYCCAGLNFGYFYDRSPHHRVRRRGGAGLHDGRRSRRRPCPAAARRTCGWTTGARSTMRWVRPTRCCASTGGPRSPASWKRRRPGTFRWRWST